MLTKIIYFLFFFSSRRRHTRSYGDWSRRVLFRSVGVLAGLAGVRLPIAVPVWLGLLLGVGFFFLPDLEIKQRADKRRRDFRHAIGSFLDLRSEERRVGNACTT